MTSSRIQWIISLFLTIHMHAMNFGFRSNWNLHWNWLVFRLRLIHRYRPSQWSWGRRRSSFRCFWRSWSGCWGWSQISRWKKWCNRNDCFLRITSSSCFHHMRIVFRCCFYGKIRQNWTKWITISSSSGFTKLKLFIRHNALWYRKRQSNMTVKREKNYMEFFFLLLSVLSSLPNSRC